MVKTVGYLAFLLIAWGKEAIQRMTEENGCQPYL